MTNSGSGDSPSVQPAVLASVVLPRRDKIETYDDQNPDTPCRRHGGHGLRQEHCRSLIGPGAWIALRRFGRSSAAQKNKMKMAAGIPLNDADREPWLGLVGAILA